uniref:Cryptide Pep-8 n=1 Tax=Tityus obscurus TaxID=1221240 RepID=CRY8_TITOB
KIITPPIR